MISKREGCEPHRKVTLFMYEDFVSDQGQDHESDAHGDWRVRKDLKPGKYFAKVDSAKAGGHPLPLRRLQERARLRATAATVSSFPSRLMGIGRGTLAGGGGL